MQSGCTMDLTGLFPVLVIFGIVAIAAYSIKVAKKKIRQKLEPIALAMGGELVSGYFLQDCVRFMSHGQEQRIEVLPAVKNRPPTLILKQVTELDFDLGVMTESMITRAAERLGLPIEIKTGDPVFDEKYLLSSSAKDRAQIFLSSSERRQIIDNFFNAGFTMMNLKMKMLSVSKPNYADQDLDPAFLRAQLDQLQKFING